MYYATQGYIGNNTTPKRETARAALQTIEPVYSMDAAAKGCKRNTKGQKEISTDSHAADGFLRTVFLPKLLEPETVQDCKEDEKMVRDFYKSLTQLSKHFDISTMHTSTYKYPYNMALAMWDARKQLSRKVRHWEELKVVQDNDRTFLISKEQYSTGNTLYYIPVVPLYRMLQCRQDKLSAHLLLSVCSYLYHIADIPYYRQQDSYLYWQYEMLKEWVLNDDYDECAQENIRELEQGDWIGDRMEKILQNRANLLWFKERLRSYRSTNLFEQACLKLATAAYSLYEQHPKSSIFRYGSADLDEDYLDNTITMDKYISFYAIDSGWVGENLIESINSEFQEYGVIDEPVIIKHFDGKEKVSSKNLDFENRLFDLLDDLIGLLNEY